MFSVKNVIEAAVLEDVSHGDITSDLLFKDTSVKSAHIIAKESFILSGIEIARDVFTCVDPYIIFRSKKKDGAKVKKGDVLIELTGAASSLLKAERVALNFIQRLSGISTLTAAYTSAIRGCRAKIVDTRKTTPGLRALEKYAVRMGGGFNHRMGLFDGILIKENHISACGSITGAIDKARENAPHTLKIEIEVSTIDQVSEALESGADIIMLDNMDIDTMKSAVKMISGEAIVEASGNVTLDNVADVAFTGVDIISVGALTHSAKAVDISMLFLSGVSS